MASAETLNSDGETAPKAVTEEMIGMLKEMSLSDEERRQVGMTQDMHVKIVTPTKYAQ